MEDVRRRFEEELAWQRPRLRKWVSFSGTGSYLLKLRILNTYVISVPTYCNETWTINVVDEAHLEAVEMWFLRRMLRIS